MKQTLCSVLPATPTVGDVVYRDDGTFYCCFADGVWTQVGGATPKVYSTTEQLTNATWVNGDPIYRKVIDLGGLPTVPGSNTPHGIVGLRLVTDMWGVATDTGPGPYSSIQLGHANSVLFLVIRLTVDQTNINILVGDDWTAYDSAYVVLEYTRDP